MTKEELEKEYFWEIKNFHEGILPLADLLEMVYRGGYYDGVNNEDWLDE